MNDFPNKLLAALPPEVFAALSPCLKVAKLVPGDAVAEVNQRHRSVYFPYSGAISLVVELKTGGIIETAMVGYDGVFDGLSGLDGNISLVKAVVHLQGVAALIEAERFREIADEHVSLRAVTIRFNQKLAAETRQSVACNASHSIEARLCRWLLRIRDLARTDDLQITQELLAQMLGVRRPSISTAAATLQKAGMISYHRGQMHLMDIARLSEAACECYSTIKSVYEE